MVKLRTNRLLVYHAGRPLAGDVPKYRDREDRDHRQRNEVGEREERREDPLSDLLVVLLALLHRRHAVRAQDRHVDDQHDHPDRGHHGDDVASGPDAHRAHAVHDRHVTDHGDEHEGIDRHVGGDVDQVVEQHADGLAERPRTRRLLVGGERRNDDDEAQVSDGEVQQQEVGDGAHRALRHDDVDDETVADDADQRDARKDDRGYDSVEEVDEVARTRLGRVGRVRREHRRQRQVLQLVETMVDGDLRLGVGELRVIGHLYEAVVT